MPLQSPQPSSSGQPGAARQTSVNRCGTTTTHLRRSGTSRTATTRPGPAVRPLRYRPRPMPLKAPGGRCGITHGSRGSLRPRATQARERLRRGQSRGPLSLRSPRLSSAGRGRRKPPRGELRGAASARHRRRPQSPKTSPLCRRSVPPPSRSWLRAAPSTGTRERLTPAARPRRGGWRL